MSGSNTQEMAADMSQGAAIPAAPAGRATLSDAQKVLIEQRVANEKPSTGAAYLLDIFLGPFGAHRFYLGQTGTAIAMLILTITVVGAVISGPWAIVDLFLIPGMIQKRTDEIRQKLTVEALSHC